MNLPQSGNYKTVLKSQNLFFYYTFSFQLQLIYKFFHMGFTNVLAGVKARFKKNKQTLKLPTLYGIKAHHVGR